jgi:glutathione S-transferase
MSPPVSEARTVMKIFGDTNSGNCLKVKWVCDHLRLPYRWIDIDTMKGETRTPEFLKLNSAGQVPAVELDGAVQCHHPLSRARQRPDPEGCLYRCQDG